MTIRLLVCGGRDYTDYDRVNDEILEVLDTEPDVVIIHGGARGADSLAKRWARKDRFATEEAYPAKWDEHGKSAGPIRNQQMIDEGRPDYALVFPGGKGTFDMMTRLFNNGIPFKYVGTGRTRFTPHEEEL